MSFTASLTQIGCGGAAAGFSTSGNAAAARSRAISTSGGRAGSRMTRPLRRKSTRRICGSARACSTNAGSRNPVSPACVVRKYTSAGSTVPSQSSTDWRNDATIIAIAAISEKLATIAARLTAACPGAARSCASANAKAGLRGSGNKSNTVRDRRGTSATQPTSRQAMAA